MITPFPHQEPRRGTRPSAHPAGLSVPVPEVLERGAIPHAAVQGGESGVVSLGELDVEFLVQRDDEVEEVYQSRSTGSASGRRQPCGGIESHWLCHSAHRSSPVPAPDQPVGPLNTREFQHFSSSPT